MGLPRVMAEPWWTNSFMVTFEFRCNLACSFCMVEDVLDVYPGTSLAEFEAIASDPARLEGVSRIILTGGEVTLSPQLLDYVRLARSIPGIEHVRLQTNAVRLNRKDVLAALLDAGVDELFVSVHGHDEATCDALTRRRGSFRAIVAGLETIASSSAALFTNTAIVGPNHQHLHELVELVRPFGPRSMEFWNYWPRADEEGGRALAARVEDVRAPLLRALRACVDAQIPPVVKWFPRCLLEEMSWCQDDGQPPAAIADDYFDRAPEYGCLYRGVCADGEVCSGLSHPYIRRFGWEQQLVSPRRTRSPGTERGDVGRSLTQSPTTSTQRSVDAVAWLASLGITRERELAGHRLVAASPSSDGREIAVRLDRGGDVVEARVRVRDPSRRAFARTRSFDVLTFPPSPGREAVMREVTLAFARALAAGDPGGRALPE